MLDLSNQSIASLYRKDVYIPSHDVRERTLDLLPHQESKTIQSEFHDDSIFPPFDHRICLRCKKNDLLSPKHCKYANIQKLEDLSFQSNKSSKSYKISENHIYGVNVGFKSKLAPSTKTYQRKVGPGELSNKGVNTIISNNDFLQNITIDFQQEDFMELKTPKTDTRRKIN